MATPAASAAAAAARPLEKPLVWIDCEMTGLDLSKDHIIEIACIITDKDLNVVAESDEIIINQPQHVMDGMNAWCVEHHGKSGLTAAVLASTVSMADAEQRVLDFIRAHVPDRGAGLLAGNSVHADKQFLQIDMPRVVEHLSYRILDVSTVKEIVNRWYPKVAEGRPAKNFSHRALDDIRESIAELKYYRERAFIPRDE
ncbi:Phosphatidylinositol 3,4,5-trisphosphate-dependent Rac exchanger 2 protein [Blastocladiella emersonii ATCC 22665]|nr:Phosphatidylinositol 3,4,5-trisphosphate-dependent Rac exchanger 2 protein [Blastocladiella emersonii ATCC 22665]